MLNYLLLAFAIIHLCLLSWSFRWGDNSSLRLWLLRAMLLGMFYDNLIQALGHWFIDQSWFEGVSAVRYFAHVAVLPFLTLFGLSIMRSADIALAENRFFMIFCYLFTFCALCFGIYHEVFLLQLEPKSVLGVDKFVSLSSLPPIATILTNIFLLIMAVFVWKKSGWKWLFLGGLFIFILNGATGAQPWGFVVGNFAELIFIVCLLLTERHFMRETA